MSPESRTTLERQLKSLEREQEGLKSQIADLQKDTSELLDRRQRVIDTIIAIKQDIWND